MNVNKYIIVGRLGDAPEVRFTESGQPVCNMSVATSDTWKDKNTGEKKEKTTWHRVVIWGPQAENCGKYLEKGQLVFVEGAFESRKYTDKEGIERYTAECKARDVRFGPKSAGAGNGGGAPSYAPADDPDIPF